MKGPKRSGRSDETSASTPTVSVLTAPELAGALAGAAAAAGAAPSAARCPACDGAFGEHAASSAAAPEAVRPSAPACSMKRRRLTSRRASAPRSFETRSTGPPPLSERGYVHPAQGILGGGARPIEVRGAQKPGGVFGRRVQIQRVAARRVSVLPEPRRRVLALRSVVPRSS